MPDERFYTLIGLAFFVVLGVAMSFALNMDHVVKVLSDVAPPALAVRVD